MSIPDKTYKIEYVGEPFRDKDISAVANGHPVFTGEQGGASLSMAVDLASGRVSAASFTAADESRDAFLNQLCAICVGLPMIEVSDHAVIRLEKEMRQSDWKPPVAGVVMPENIHPMFKDLTALVRDLVGKYVEAGNKLPERNTHSDRFSEEIQSKSPEERQNLVVNLVKDLQSADWAAGGTLGVHEVSRDRVTLVLDGYSYRDKPAILMKVEAEIKSRLDPAFHVYLIMEKDQNKIRRL